MAAEGIDLYLPTYVARSGLEQSRERLHRFFQDHRLDRYERVHVFAFIAGGWTFNPLGETRVLPNLSSVVYDRSPYQERAPRIALERLRFLTWLKYGPVVFDVARTPYAPLSIPGVKVGLVVETSPTSFIKRFAATARGYGTYDFKCDAFEQRHDDCFYVAMSHDELYARFAEVWPEVRSFIRTGQFSASANRTPPAGDTLAGEPSGRGSCRGDGLIRANGSAPGARDPECEVGENTRLASARMRRPSKRGVHRGRRIRARVGRGLLAVGGAHGPPARRAAARRRRLHPVAAVVQSARRHARGRRWAQERTGEIFNDLPDRVADVVILVARDMPCGSCARSDARMGGGCRGRLHGLRPGARRLARLDAALHRPDGKTAPDVHAHASRRCWPRVPKRCSAMPRRAAISWPACAIIDARSRPVAPRSGAPLAAS